MSTPAETSSSDQETHSVAPDGVDEEYVELLRHAGLVEELSAPLMMVLSDVLREGATDLEASPSTPKVPLSITYLHFGGTNYFEGAIGRGAYVAGGIGATWMSPSLSGLSSEVRPSLNLGLGFEWPITGALSLKAELRGYFTLINSNSSLFCSGGCVVAIKGDGLTQVEGLVGLNLAF